MNQFTLEATLDTREPYTIDLLGPPSGVTYNISGTLKMNVLKAVQLKQLSVGFLGQVAKSEPLTTDKIDHALIDTQSLYLPGEYTFPFRLTLPGDIATTDSSKLLTKNTSWKYTLILSATPSGLIARRKEFKQPVKVRRLHVAPSSSCQARFTASRQNQFDCSLFGPKIVTLGLEKISSSLFLHPYITEYCVKEIQAYAFQNEWVELTVYANSIENRGNRMGTPLTDKEAASARQHRDATRSARVVCSSCNIKHISNTVVISNPNQLDSATSWGRETPISLELDLLPSEMLPAELLTWVKVSHGVHYTIVFQDETIRPLVVKAPFTAIKVLEDPWTHVIDRTANTEEADRTELPGYGEEMDHSTLLDSNTSRIIHEDLYRELYPEREVIVPDVVDDLPPVYERDEELPEPYSEKSVSAA
ncbi:hypothetical protein BGX26_001872 [Mortierella sp. AD094]|nr:hypothetical protein BGX26_001872 [Mortierella sp. AD094]